MIVVGNEVLFKGEEISRCAEMPVGSKQIIHQGQIWVKCHDNVLTFQVLAKAGYNFEGPITRHYDWPTKYGAPYKHQVAMSNFMVSHDRCYNLSDMGAGKTLSALWAIDFMLKVGLIKKVLVLCPLSITDNAWADELKDHLPHLDHQVVHGTPKKRQAAFDAGATVEIMNYDGTKTMFDQLTLRFKRGYYDLIVVDEGSFYRTHGTDRWNVLNTFQQKCKRMWWMTATPASENPTDVWSQSKLMFPHKTPKYFSHFRNKVMVHVSQYRWAPKKGHELITSELLSPQIRFETEQVVKLPPAIHTDITVPLSAEQQKCHDEMVDDLCAEHAKGLITASNEGVKLGKLLQIAAGMVYDDAGNVVDLMPKAKLNFIGSLLSVEDKIIIFVAYRHTAAYVAKKFTDKGIYTGMVHGGVSAGKRKGIFKDFQEGSMRLLIAVAETTSHGLTFVSCATTVWMTPPNRNEVLVQANGRTRRPGQTRPQNFIYLSSTDTEKQVFQRLRAKEKTQNLLIKTLAKRLKV